MRSPSLTLAPDRSTGAIVSRFAPAAEVQSGLKRNTMACIRFGRPPVIDEDPRVIPLGLDLLAGPVPGAVELWTSDRPVDFDRDEGFGFAANGEFLFGHLYLLELELESMAASAFKAYARLTAFLERMGYPRLLRCWNFVHDINHGEADRERYKQFSLGRYQALAGQPGFERQLPAATAIGMHEPGLLLYFLAGRESGVQVENPRQVPAFEYPRQYGPRSPSFSRASFARFGGLDHLLVSGTASVVGHATCHPHESGAQLDETLANLQALLEHAARTHLHGGHWQPETVRLYLRDRADVPLARAALQKTLGRDTPVVYLEGDICRSDLRLEIEGLYRASRTDGAA